MAYCQLDPLVANGREWLIKVNRTWGNGVGGSSLEAPPESTL